MGPVVEISFVSDDGPGEWVPKHLVPPGLIHRLAIIQDTYVPDLVDMHFDEGLWRGVVDFVARFDPTAEVTVIPDWSASEEDAPGSGVFGTFWRRLTGGQEPAPAHPPIARSKEVRLSEFLTQWDALPVEDREVPSIVQARRDGAIILCVITEYWNRIGGPKTYHDSYTYSVFAGRELGDELQRFLSAQPEAHRWLAIPAR